MHNSFYPSQGAIIYESYITWGNWSVRKPNLPTWGYGGLVIFLLHLVSQPDVPLQPPYQACLLKAHSKLQHDANRVRKDSCLPRCWSWASARLRSDFEEPNEWPLESAAFLGIFSTVVRSDTRLQWCVLFVLCHCLPPACHHVDIRRSVPAGLVKWFSSGWGRFKSGISFYYIALLLCVSKLSKVQGLSWTVAIPVWRWKDLGYHFKRFTFVTLP